MTMAYSYCIREAVEDFLREDDWRYQADDEKELIRMGVNLKSKLKECKLIVDLREEFYLVYATINIQADEESRLRVAEYLSRANYGLRWGNFDLDMRDGEVRYKILVDCGDDCDCMPTKSVIERSIYFPASMMEKYGDGLLAVMYGFMSPEEACQQAEKPKN